MYAIDLSTRQLGVQFQLPPTEGWVSDVFEVSDGVIFARAGHLTPLASMDTACQQASFLNVKPPSQAGCIERQEPNVFYALDEADKRVVWTYDLGDDNRTLGGFHAVGNGIIAHFSAAGLLTVIGRTGASIVPIVDVSSLYPAPGAAVSVDFRSSRAGVQGAPTSVHAIWEGDAGADHPGDAPLTYAFASAGDHTARFQLRNDAGQVSEAEIIFHVGATPPQNPTFLEDAFSQENQNSTFFAIGLALTGAGAVVGYARVRRDRTRLTKELKSVETTYEATKERPLDCEAALAECKAHARRLLLAGKFTDAQFALLEKRVDELSASVRLSTLEDKIDFLPVGIAKTLRAMLADGRITGWEHRSIMAAIEHDTILTGEQKERVRRLVDDWFARDTQTK